MKKTLSVLCVATLLFSSVPLTSVSAADNKINYEKTEIKTITFDDAEPVKFTCLIRGDLPSIPYIAAEDYISQLFTEPIAAKDNRDGTFTLTNDSYDMIINAEKDTIRFDDFEHFISVNSKPYLDEESADYLDESSDFTFIGEHKGAELDLGKYHIDITSYEGRVYLPYNTLNDIFANNYRQVLYENGELTFVQAMDEEFIENIGTKIEEKRDQTLTDFIYNELCFNIDYFYGRPSSAKIAKSIDEKGFDKTLDTFDNTTAYAKKLLLSGRGVDFCTALSFLDCYFYDGGHTNLSFDYQSAFDSLGYEDIGDMIGDLFRNPSDIDLDVIVDLQTTVMTKAMNSNTLSAKKETAYQQFRLVNMWDDAAVYESGKTVIFDFDEFTDTVVEPFKWSLDYAAEHNAENFVIDLSTNSGGSTAVSMYMLSVICGDDVMSPTESCVLTGNTFKEIADVDKNLDGKFDEKDDTVTYDLNFAFLTSSSSFSCANLTPCTAQDNGIAILGEKSGGGTCNIAPHFFPDGGMYTLSGLYTTLHDNGEDFDSGAIPDVVLPGADKDYEGFYDIDRINAGIKGFYSDAPRTIQMTEKATESTEPAETTEPTEKIDNSDVEPKNPVTDNQSVMMIVFTVIIALAVILIMLAVVMLIGKKKKQKNDTDIYR